MITKIADKIILCLKKQSMCQKHKLDGHVVVQKAYNVHPNLGGQNMISVNEMLKLPVLSGSSILAGQSGLNRKIKYLDILEVPDAENWLVSYEFILTTAFAFKDNEDGLSKLVKVGAKRNLAGFGIKLGRFINSLPASVIEAANRYSMPIIGLPINVPYIQIIKDVMFEIIKSEESLKRSLAKSDVFIQLLEGDVQTAVEELGSYGWERGTPVRIGVLTSSVGFNNDDIALLRHVLLRADLEFILAPRHEDLVILLRDLPVETIKEVVEFLKGQLKGKNLMLGLSEPRPLGKCIKHSLNEAQVASQLSKVLGYKIGVIPFSQIKMLSIILEHPQLGEIISTASHMLSPILDHDANQGTELFKTLKVFLESGKNQQIASSLLQIHRNTLRYRLGQIEDLLGDQLLDSKSNFILQLAIFFHSVYQHKADV